MINILGVKLDVLNAPSVTRAGGVVKFSSRVVAIVLAGSLGRWVTVELSCPNRHSNCSASMRHRSTIFSFCVWDSKNQTIARHRHNMGVWLLK